LFWPTATAWTYFGRPTIEGKTQKGALCAPKQALPIPDPLSVTRACTSSRMQIVK
jgi:hypothetical protein